MIKIKGQFNTAVVFTDKIEDTAAEQIRTLCNQPFVKGSKIRVMPDVHAGMGCTIGTTMTIDDKVVPNLVGVDIGCGIEVIRIENPNINLERLDNLIHDKIPSGFNIRKKDHEFIDKINLDNLRCKNEVNIKRARLSIGTLGGGNHFIEANKDEEGNLYIAVHSGSRHLGHEVASLYQKKAQRQLNRTSREDLDALISRLREEGREKDVKKELRKMKSQTIEDIPKDLAYVSRELFDDYINDMKIVQKFAELNRKAMVEEIVRGMGLNVLEDFTTIHNYIDTDNMILRKGAVSAQKGEKLIIPINMRDGSLICIGKGNEYWNYSAPHGAGRIMSRREAKRTFNLSEFKKSMEGIYTTTANSRTLDECPFAYKPIEEIMENTSDTVDIIHHIKPVYNFKGS